MPNRLANETSPYLLQHKDNPVDWFPWGEAAFQKAQSENKPIFLSIGYSACHWCHVMAHESFEDHTTAAIMNEHFVNIKVDREERPDVDSIYMSAVQALTGGGGWPMSVWLLPDGRPFYAGTYFPLTPRSGMPSFSQVLRRIAELYRDKQADIEKDAGNLTNAITRQINLDTGSTQSINEDMLNTAFQEIAGRYDAEWGGFGGAPKFPPSMIIEFLLRLYQRYGWQHALDMVTHTLDRMMRGGMYDQVGGGFHRYSVDRKWVVPHFEKMLYDNALLIRAYLYGYQVTGDAAYKRVVQETIRYIEREMTSPDGAFYSAQDADSEGVEGKFFIWNEAELRSILLQHTHENIDPVLDYWGVLNGPNFEGESVLWIPDKLEVVAERHDLEEVALRGSIERARDILFTHREQRVPPGLDDKVLTAWNGLLIKSVAEAGRIFDDNALIAMAERAATFVLANLLKDGRLRRTYKHGQAKFNAYLEDYAFFIEGLIELYQATLDVVWMKHALMLTETMVSQFWDDQSGFYDTSHDHETLITRPQDITDGAIPSGTSSAVAVLLRMSVYVDRPVWRDMAERIMNRFSSGIQSYPSAFGYLASQCDFALGATKEIVIVGNLDEQSTNDMLREINSSYRPNDVIAFRPLNQENVVAIMPLLRDREQIDGVTTAYVCQNYACKLPVNTVEGLRKQLLQP